MSSDTSDSGTSDNALWVVQSRAFYPETITPLFYQMLYLIIASSCMILIVSAIQHGRAFKSVRTCVDIAAVSSLLLSALLLVAMHDPTPIKTAVVRDFLCYGVLQTIVLLCDNYMFYKSYAVVVKVQTWKRHVIHGYVWIILILTWLPKWTVLPFFTAQSNPSYLTAYFYLDQISYYGNIGYNFYFTVQFIRVLMIITHNVSNSSSKRSNDRTIILITKGIGHCVTSSLAALLRTLDTNQTAGFPIWIFILLVGLQIWFNSKIEILFYVSSKFVKPHLTSKSGDGGKITPPSLMNSAQSALSSDYDATGKVSFPAHMKPTSRRSLSTDFRILATSEHYNRSFDKSSIIEPSPTERANNSKYLKKDAIPEK
jgi:hypothetical protein